MTADTRSSRPILVVDDDVKIVRLVRVYLEREGFRVVEAFDGRGALTAAAHEPPLLVVLDRMLPELDGIGVLRSLRRESRVPVILLSARGTVSDRIEGLEEGADDYLPKPFSPAELVLRVERLLERAGEGGNAPGRPPLTHGELSVDPDRHEVTLRGVPVRLTLGEFRLLHALLAADGRVLTRDQLMDSLYGPEEGVLDRTIDVHIGRLRDKLRDDADAPRYIATVRGIGYRAATPDLRG